MSVRDRLRRHGPAAALYLALAALFVAPLSAPAGDTPGPRMPGAQTSDLADHVWGYWWFGHCLRHGQLPVRTDVSHMPPGGPLLFVDPVGAITSLPLQPLVGLAAAYTLVAALQLLFAALAAYWLALRLGLDRASATLAGAVFAFSSYALSCLHDGTTEYLVTGFIPLFVAALDAALREGGRRRVLLAGLAWCATAIGAAYHGVFVGLLAVAVVAARITRRELTLDRAVARVGGVAAVAALTYAPVALLTAWSVTAPDAVVHGDNAPGWSFGALPATDLLTFVAPFDYHYPDMAATGNEGIVHANALGWVALALAAVGVLRSRRARAWALPALGYGVLMLGPRLVIAGRALSFGDGPLMLPYGWLCFPGSPLRLVHHPFRLVVIGMLLLGLIAAFGLRALTRDCPPRRRAIAAGAVALAVALEAMLLSPARWPLPTTALPRTPTLTALADEPGGVLDFPPGAADDNRHYLLRATRHGRPVPYGVNTILARPVLDNGLVRTLLWSLDDLDARMTTREGRAVVVQPSLRRAELPGAAVALAELGYSALVLHRGRLADGDVAAVEALLVGALGPPRHDDGAVAVFALPDARGSRQGSSR